MKSSTGRFESHTIRLRQIAHPKKKRKKVEISVQILFEYPTKKMKALIKQIDLVNKVVSILEGIH